MVKLVTFLHAGAQRLGALLPGSTAVCDLRAASEILHSGTASQLSHLGSMQALIEWGSAGLDHVNQVVDTATTSGADPEFTRELADVTLLAPLPTPIQYRDFMLFEGHVFNCLKTINERKIQAAPEAEQEKMREQLIAQGAMRPHPSWYKQPIYYKGNRFAFQGTGADLPWPPGSSLRDFECEMAMVIGKGGKDIPASGAREHIFGYSILNDFSARDWQMEEIPSFLGPAKGKDFDGANCMGPCIVTADEIDPQQGLRMEARVNGEVWGGGDSSTMHHTWEDAIAHVSKSETIYAGEVFGSGTVTTGCGLEQDRYLELGDVVELEIEGIGKLKNRIVG